MAVGPLAKVVYHPIAGFRLGTTEAGMKVSGRKDLVSHEHGIRGYTITVE